MKPGDNVEIAIWLTGEEPLWQIEDFKLRTRVQTDNAARHYHVEVGPFDWKIKKPGEDRVPKVPDHISGIDVGLLVGEAKVIHDSRPMIYRESGFVVDLPKAEREKLRRLTRRAHQRQYPGDRLNDRQCDAIIEFLGPDVAVQTLKNG